MIPLWFRPWMAWALLFILLCSGNWRFYTWWQAERGARIRAEQALGQAQAAIHIQNKAVEDLQKEGANQAAKLKTAQGKADQVRIVTETKVEQILVAAAPSGCEEALRWGVGQVRDLAGPSAAPLQGDKP